MISKQDLLEAIAECQGERNPNANTCIKMSAFYILLDHLYAEEKPTQEQAQPFGYSTSAGYTSDTEFMQKVEAMDVNKVWQVMDDLMCTLAVVNPRLYNGVLQELDNV